MVDCSLASNKLQEHNTITIYITGSCKLAPNKVLGIKVPAIYRDNTQVSKKMSLNLNSEWKSMRQQLLSRSLVTKPKIELHKACWNQDYTCGSRSSYPAVPAGLVETWVANSSVALEIPKSATFAERLSSSNMLLGLTSLWITGGSWNYQAPLKG